MMMARRMAAALCVPAACGAATASAQEVQLPAGYAPGVAMGFGSPNAAWTPIDAAHPLPTGGKQEALVLASGNVAAAAQPVYGGDYLLAQSCTGYGAVALQVLGPDGAAFLTVTTRTAMDAAPVGVAIGSNAVVRVDLSRTTGCSVNLSRVP